MVEAIIVRDWGLTCEYLHSFILIILFYLVNLVTVIFPDSRLDLGSSGASYCSGSGGAIYTQAH